MSRILKLVLIVALIALAIEGFTLYQKKHGEADAAESAGAPPAMPVPVLTITETPTELWKEFSGRLTAVDYAEIRPQVSGTITSLNFQDGQIVKAGDVLITIDPRPYEAAAAQARADVAAANEDAAFAKRELARAEELLKTGAISKQGYDQRVSTLKLNKSAIASAEGRLKAALVDLDRTAIKAPIPGRISRPEITVGNLVTAANAPLLTSIASNNGIYADFDVDEATYLSFVRGTVGQDVAGEKEIPVRLFLKGDDKQQPIAGKIKSFDNRIDPNSGTIRARAVFDNGGGVLLPGMFGRVQIGSPSKEARILIPETAVSTDQSRKFVYIVGDGNAATYREVKLGDVSNGQRIVLDGLKAGDRVITDGIMKIRPGAKVDPKTPEEIKAMKEQMAAQAAQGAGGEKQPDEKKAAEPKAEGAKPDDSALATPPADKAAQDANASDTPKNAAKTTTQE